MLGRQGGVEHVCLARCGVLGEATYAKEERDELGSACAPVSLFEIWQGSDVRNGGCLPWWPVRCLARRVVVATRVPVRPHSDGDKLMGEQVGGCG
jgi:hypothetical protein